MTPADRSGTGEPRAAGWLVPAGAGVLLAIGLLWTMRPVGTVCRELYPPECVPVVIDGPALVGGVLLVLGYAAFAIVATLVRGAARVPLLVSGATLLGVIAAGALLASIAI